VKWSSVIISFEEYEYFEIQTMLKKRLKNYNQKNNIPWEEIKEEV
jgi:hypothetical protein